MIFINTFMGNKNFPRMSFIWEVSINGKRCQLESVNEIQTLCRQHGFEMCLCYPYDFVKLGKLQHAIDLWKYDYYFAESMRVYGSNPSQYFDMDVRKLKIVATSYKVREHNWKKK